MRMGMTRLVRRRTGVYFRIAASRGYGSGLCGCGWDHSGVLFFFVEAIVGWDGMGWVRVGYMSTGWEGERKGKGEEGMVGH